MVKFAHQARVLTARLNVSAAGELSHTEMPLRLDSVTEYNLVTSATNGWIILTKVTSTTAREDARISYVRFYRASGGRGARGAIRRKWTC